MRRLVIICEQKDVPDIEDRVREYAHPGVIGNFIKILVLDLARKPSALKYEVLDEGRDDRVPAGSTTHEPTMCFTQDIAMALNLKQTLEGLSIEVHQLPAKKLRKPALGHGQDSPLEKIVKSCGLTLRSAAVHMLKSYSHVDHPIDSRTIDIWLGQFSTLGVPKIGNYILGQMRLIEQSDLGTRLAKLPIADGAVLCVNRDMTTSGKSGDVVSNLVLKRSGGGAVFSSPADAIEAGHRHVAIFEDGLWTATEVIGVLDSMLGVRTEKLKSPLVVPPDGVTIADLRFTLAYGMATDYGLAMLRQFLVERGLTNFDVVHGEIISVAGADVSTQLASSGLTVPQMRHDGPPAGVIRPHLLGETLPYTEQIEQVRAFCMSVGRQLFANYDKLRGTRSDAHRPWSAEKLDKCALGMWSLGLTLAFGHSVPKASVPLLWASGPVEWGGKRIEDWKPLFPNAM